MKKMEHCDMEGSPSRISRASAVPRRAAQAEAAGCPTDTRAFETWRSGSAFLTALPQGCNSFCQNYLSFFSPDCPSSKQTLPFITICAKSHSSATQSREDRFPGGRRKKTWSVAGWLRDARYWEFPSSCLNSGAKGAFECCAEFCMTVFEALSLEFYQLVGSYI